MAIVSNSVSKSAGPEILPDRNDVVGNRRDFYAITAADFIVRSAYQMGKTPLLPLFAASLGATDAFLGIIVSVSTLTGMVLKPVIGILSDRWGRRLWLLAATAFFAGMPFVYRFVQTPEQLALIRVVHGLATAIFGPVTLAYITEQGGQRRAERLGWFEMARSGGYIAGPAAAGWLLLSFAPVQVFTVIGFLSVLAFVPILSLQEPPTRQARNHQRVPLWQQAKRALTVGGRTPAVWLSGGLEATVYLATYAAKAFLPIYALAAGANIAVVGLFFSVQEGTALLLKPWAGRAGDRIGYLYAISGGMLIVGIAFLLLPLAQSHWALLLLAAAIGCGQALVYPSTIALISTQIDAEHVGAGMGLAGSLENAGKVAGPVLGGLLIAWLDYTPMLRGMGGMLVLAAVAVFWLRSRMKTR